MHSPKCSQLSFVKLASTPMDLKPCQLWVHPAPTAQLGASIGCRTGPFGGSFNLVLLVLRGTDLSHMVIRRLGTCLLIVISY